MTRKSLHQQQVDYYRLCDEAQRLGIPTSHYQQTFADRGITFAEFGPDERYLIFERQGGAKTLIATCPTPAAVGIALCQLAEDRWEAGDTSTPVVGVLDGERNRWVSGLWVGGGLA